MTLRSRAVDATTESVGTITPRRHAAGPMDEGTAPMTSALAKHPVRLPAAAAETHDRARVRDAEDVARPRRSTTATDTARDGARAIAATPPHRNGEAARPGARPDGPGRPDMTAPPLVSDDDVVKLAGRADKLFAELVQQRDIIRDAVAFGDTASAAKAFGRAAELFREIVAIGDDARIDMSSSEDGAARTAAKRRIGDDVTNAYEWANLIEAAMPGDQHL